jgi:vitamin B12 transporter
VKFRHATLAVAFALALPFGARAADIAPSPSPSPSPAASAPASGTLREIGNVVTSDRRSEPADAATKPTFVVDRTRIDEYGARTIADALQGVPGLNLPSYGPFGAQVDYGLRGGSSEQTLVLVDGIPITDPTTGTVELGQLSTIGVDRIEIVESGGSTLYGASAAAGVINIITRVPRGAYIEASDGSYGDRDLRVSAGNGIVGASIERHVSTGDFAYPSVDYGPQSSCNFGMTPCSFPAGVRNDAFGELSAARISLDVPLVDGFRVRARIDDQSTQIGVPGGITFLTPTASQNTTNGSFLVSLQRPTPSGGLTIDLAGSQTRLAFIDPNPNDGYYGEDDVYTGRSQVSIRDAFAGARFDGLAGVDLSRQSGNFTFPTTPGASASAPPIDAFATGHSDAQSAAYAQAGYSPVGGTRFVAGLRAENDSPFGGVLAPSFGGTIRSGVLHFSGNVGEAFIVPNFSDLYYPGFSNPNLKPEKLQTADATVSFAGTSGTLTAGWFDRNGSNFIISLPPAYIPFNAQHAAVAGVQITAASKSVLGVVAQIGFTDVYRALDYDDGSRLPESPVGNAVFSLEHPFAATRFDYGLRWSIVGSDGADREAVTGPLQASYDAYDTFDAFLRYKIARDAIVTLRGFNLGNEFASPIFGYPLPGARYYLEISTR